MAGKIYLIADPHFGHSNIIKYCNRPFVDADEMDNSLIERWNSVVDNEDEVLVLGDFLMCKEPRVACELYLSQLNGNKHLILGNHDRQSNKAYLDAGFLSVSKEMSLMDIKDSSKVTVLRHHPPKLDEVRPYGTTYVYGHTHSETDPLCVSVEGIDYTPILLEDLYKRIFLASGKTAKSVCVPSCWPVEEDSVPAPKPAVTFTTSLGGYKAGDTIKYMKVNNLL